MSDLVSIHRAEKATIWATRRRYKNPPKPTPEHPLIISASELRDFLRCRVKWWWRWMCQLQPLKDPVAFAIGDLAHQIHEDWYKHSAAQRTVKLMERRAALNCRSYNDKQLDEEGRRLVEGMLVGYAAWALGDHPDSDAAIGLVDPTPEKPFIHNLTADGRIKIKGYIDLPFRPVNKKKTVACVELKTASQFRDNDVEMLLQNTVYLWALRKEFPKEQEYELHYREMRKQLPSPRVHAPLFQAQMISRSNEEIDQWARDVESIACDMLDAAIYPTPTKDCAWDCDFKEPCLLRGHKGDLEHVLTHSYKKREKR